MRYLGSKLKAYIRNNRGKYTEICQIMLNGKKGLDAYYQDGRNIQIEKLSKILFATRMPIDYFVEFEDYEKPVSMKQEHPTIGGNNIINSTVNNDLNMKVDHLNEVIRLKDQIIADKEVVIALKDKEIERWKEYTDRLMKTIEDSAHKKV